MCSRFPLGIRAARLVASKICVKIVTLSVATGASYGRMARGRHIMVIWQCELKNMNELQKKLMSSLNENSRPVGIDLFAGAGGLSLGFEQAGFDVAAAIEIDPIHCAVHEYNFPNSTTICASVVDLTGAEIRHRARLGNRDIDCVFGGAPCQGFSMIGKRVLDDPRNQLVFHYVRIIRELQPKYCVFENVKGLTVGKHKEFLAELIDALDEAGYDVLLPYQVLNAVD